MKPTTVVRISLALGALALLAPADLQGQTAVLGVDSRNPRWLRAGGQGKAIVLTGSHTWSVFQNYQGENFRFTTDYFNPVILANDHNFIRGWIWEDDYYTPLVYSKPGAKFNLGVVNSNLFGPGRPIQDRLNRARNDGVYASVMLFQGWSTGRFPTLRDPNPWENGSPPIPHHPYHKDLNSNGVDGNFLGGPDGREIQEEIAPGQTGRGESQEVLSKQRSYVNQVVDRLKGFNNIIWEVSNETHFSSPSLNWQNEIAKALRARDSNPKHLVKISCLNGAPLTTMLGMDAKLIAPCIAASSGLDIKSANPPHATGQKVLIADSDHLGPLDFIQTKGDCNQANDEIRAGTDMWAWKYFLRGYHPIFMDLGYDLEWSTCPKWGAPQLNSAWDRIRQTLGAIQKVSGKVKLHQLVPQRKEGTPSPVSWKKGSGSIFALYASGRAEDVDSGGSMLPSKGREYLVWVPKGDKVEACNLKTNRKYKVRWRSVLSGSGSKVILPPGADCQEFHNTSGSDAILHLRWGPKVKDPEITQSGAAFSFDSVGSSTEDGETFYWDFGDGGSATGPTANHVFALGEWTVTLTSTDDEGDTDSATVVVVVEAPPEIAVQPVSIAVDYGQPASFAVTATGTAPLSYRWQNKIGSTWVDVGNGAGVSGATTAVLTFSSTTTGDQGSYRGVVSNALGYAISSPVLLTVQAQAPQITLHPQPATAKIGTSVDFACNATGIPTPLFSWQKDGVAILDGARITGASTPTLTILDVENGDRGSYSCRAANALGSADSTAADLRVTVAGSLTLEELLQVILD